MKKTTFPIAERIPVNYENFGDKRTDNYHWLRDDKWPKVQDKKVLDYLNNENKYAEYILDKNRGLIDDIYDELEGRVKKDDKSVPVVRENYKYYSYINKGQEYWVHARKLISGEKQKEEIILDENEEAKGNDFLNIKTMSVSPDHKLLAFSKDIKGDERYIIYIKDLSTGKLLKDIIDNTMGIIAWDKNNKGFFYIPADEKWRSKKVYYHNLGSEQKDDKLIFHEKDEIFSVRIRKSSSKKYLFLTTSSSISTEEYFIDLDGENFTPLMISKRRDDHIYSVEHHGDYFYILTNDKGKNFRLAKTPVQKYQEKYWVDEIPYKPEIYLRNIDIYEDHLAITSSSNKNGLTSIKIKKFTDGSINEIKFQDPTYSTYVVFTTYDADSLRYSYSSLTKPRSVMEYNFSTKKYKTLKVDEIPSGYDSELYHSERVYAKSRDGAKVPISLLYKKSLFKKDGTNPLYLYGYGSYGISVPAYFNKNIISLVDRGFVYAISHIRGGDDLGYEWYEKAKFLTKKLTFNDFIDSVEYLIKEKYTGKKRIAIVGGSAGGMLLGTCLNMRPDLFQVAVAHVPFVDVLNTMLDDTLPLTPGEFKEWGNPKNKDYYFYMKSYSPYDNIEAKEYPHIFVTAGLTDPRVTYWEPAKWVAKLRHYKKDKNVLIFKTNMGAGHGGKSGRFKYLEEKAEEYGFILRYIGE